VRVRVRVRGEREREPQVEWRFLPTGNGGCNDVGGMA
jgi:hypothetical protein